MALDFRNGGTNDATLSRSTNPPVASGVCTIAGWVLPAASGANADVAFLSDGVPANYFGIALYSAAPNQHCYAVAGNGSVSASPLSNPITEVVGWHHCCGVLTSTTVAAFLDGGNKSLDSTAVALTGLTTTTVGKGIVLNQTNGSLSDVAVWNVALSDAEVAALARGISPMFIRPSALIAYWPLDNVASAGLNRTRGTTDRTLTATGTLVQTTGDSPVGEQFYFRPQGPRGNLRWIPTLQPAVGANAYWKSASDAATTDATGYTNELNKLVGVSLIQASPGATLVASTFATTSPVLGTATLAQNHVLGAATLAVSSLTIGATAVAQTHVLAASAASAGAPVLDAPAVGVKVAMTATALAVSSPVLGVSTLSQANLVTAAALALSGPVIGAGTIGQTHAFTTSFAISAPAIGAGALAQAHLLAATNLAVSAPTVPAANFGQAHKSVAADLAVAAPAIGTTAITSQVYAFTASNLVTAVKSIGVGTLKQNQVIAAASAAAGHPVLGTPTLIQGRPISVTSLAISSPIIAAAALKQAHVLLANGLDVTAPAFSAPQYSRVIVATSLAVSSPVISVGALVRTFPLFAESLAVGRPIFEATGHFEEILPPRIWFPCRDERWSYDPAAKWYDEDGDQDEKPVKQSIFTNLNDDIELTVSSGTLVGRTKPGRGPAELIRAFPPLYLLDRQIFIDWAEVELITGVAARTAAINANTAAIAANVTAIATNTAAIVANTAAIAANTNMIALIATDLNKLRQIGVAPNAAWRNFIPHDLSAGRPTLATPLLVVN